MAIYEEQNPLDYRQGGDTIDDFSLKYEKEINRIYQFLNNLREHNSNGVHQVEPQPYQFKVENGKFYIRNAENNAWLYQFDIAYRMGMSSSETARVVTSDDVSDTVTPSAIVKRNANGDIEGNITGSAAYFGNHPASEYVLQSEISTTGGANKIVKTDTAGVANISVSGSADKLNGKTADYYLTKDNLAAATTPGREVTEVDRLVKTDANGQMPVNISGSPGKLSDVALRTNNLQDGQILVYRRGSNSWTNEPKGGSMALTFNYMGKYVTQYTGESPVTVDLSAGNPYGYDGDGNLTIKAISPFEYDGDGNITIRRAV